MAHYAIGDIQGCYPALERLLEKLAFNPGHDKLYTVGDLVNRGQTSLEVLRFLKKLGSSVVTVLGNHDLHLLAVAAGQRKLRSKDTLESILKAPDCEELLFWLRHQPLLYQDKALNLLLVHAGIPPQWSIEAALTYARELEKKLQGEEYLETLAKIFSCDGNQWHDKIQGKERIGYIANALTRMRFCTINGNLDLDTKGSPHSYNIKKGYLPWFSAPNRLSQESKIVFGHWATLGFYHAHNVWGLDSGCVWGNQLTALNIETEHVIQIPCANLP